MQVALGKRNLDVILTQFLLNDEVHLAGEMNRSCCHFLCPNSQLKIE